MITFALIASGVYLFWSIVVFAVYYIALVGLIFLIIYMHCSFKYPAHKLKLYDWLFIVGIFLFAFESLFAIHLFPLLMEFVFGTLGSH